MFEEQIADFLLFFAYEFRRYANLYPNVFDKGVADVLLNYLTKAKEIVGNYDCKRIEYSDDDPMGTVYHCPKCGAELTKEVDNYCYNCRQAVYWTDVHFDSYDD